MSTRTKTSRMIAIGVCRHTQRTVTSAVKKTITITSKTKSAVCWPHDALAAPTPPAETSAVLAAASAAAASVHGGTRRLRTAETVATRQTKGVHRTEFISFRYRSRRAVFSFSSVRILSTAARICAVEWRLGPSPPVWNDFGTALPGSPPLKDGAFFMVRS